MTKIEYINVDITDNGKVIVSWDEVTETANNSQSGYDNYKMSYNSADEALEKVLDLYKIKLSGKPQSKAMANLAEKIGI